jgi:tRNA threonylcarbamoyladenosine biosynthesis protein TsaB
MKILAFETSGTAGTVALWSGAAMTSPREWSLPTELRSARSLAPAMVNALEKVGWKPSEIELVSVTTGPGSFTGLRVGVVTAKTFAFAIGCPVVGVNTLEVIARQALSSERSAITAVIDAQRSELFVARYALDPATGRTTEESATTIISADAWLAHLPADVCITGPALERLMMSIPKRVRVVEQTLWQPHASTVAQLASEKYQIAMDPRQFDPFALVPQYFRRTAAEEQWEKRRERALQP